MFFPFKITSSNILQSINNMKSSMIALTLLAASANAACTADDVTKMTICQKGYALKTALTKDTVCKYYQNINACYPACTCDDAANKDAIDAGLKLADDDVKAKDGGDCTIKCGAAETAETCAAGKTAITKPCKLNSDSTTLCATGKFVYYDDSYKKACNDEAKIEDCDTDVKRNFFFIFF